MGCKKRAVQFAKATARLLGPILVRRVATVVGILDDAPDGFLTNHQKRALVIEDAKKVFAAEKNITIDEVGGIVEGAIRTAIQNALFNLRRGVGLAEIGDDSDVGASDLDEQSEGVSA